VRRRNTDNGPANKRKARRARAAPTLAPDLQKQLDQRTRERDEALEQQAATAAVLKAISRSTFDLQSVLNTLAESAARLCEAELANIWRPTNGIYRVAGSSRYKKYLRNKDYLEKIILKPSRANATGRSLLDARTVHVHDVQADPDYNHVGIDVLGKYRTVLSVPLLRQGVPIGAIALTRSTVRPFTERQIELVTTFADQAVIAIENARLLNELRQRTSDLTESLEQQTATSEVLGIISTSSGELQPVFEAMLANAVRLCEAHYGALWLRERAGWRNAAFYGELPEAYTGQWRSGMVTQAGVDAPMDRVAKSRKPVHIPDCRTDQAYLGGHPLLVNAVDVGGIRTYLGVPMVKSNEVVGVIAIYRTEVRQFIDKQIELLTNFAAQAVIAIENARLLNELRQRTSDLSESLEQQTATSEVLKVISSSPGDLKPVFESILNNATKICEAELGTLELHESGGFRQVAAHGVPGPYRQFREHEPVLRPGPEHPLSRITATKQLVHISDVAVEPEHRRGRLATLAGARTLLGVPMLMEDKLIGVIAIYRQEVRPFSEKQIALVQNFAAQAVIAIENARLLNELRQRTNDLSEALEQQTATSEVLSVISSSPGKLEPVFNAMLESATRICQAPFGNLFLVEGDAFRTVAIHSKEVYADYWRRNPVIEAADAIGIPLDRAKRSKQLLHIPDMRLDSSYKDGNERVVSLVEIAGARTFLLVPMLKVGEFVGAIAMYRQEVRPFTENQIELVQNFAAQAVIAIENTRLLNELRDSLGRQTATSEVLSVISSSRSDLAPVFRSILENATRICEATFGSMVLREGDGFRRAALHNAPPQFEEFNKNAPILRRGMAPSVDHAIDTGQVSHTLDAAAEEPNAPIVRYAGARTLLDVPMLKGKEAIGILGIYRQEVRPFTDRQIELVRNFAAQAVIAIENARLLNELRESLDQQTATADVLKVISRSTFDLKSVLLTLVESAARLCDADKGTITRQIDGVFYRAESYGFPAEIMERWKNVPVTPERGSAAGRALLEGRTVHIPDADADPHYTFDTAGARMRSMLGVPMLREGVPIGVLALVRSDVRPFTDKQIDLVSTFADQAAIAIENVRLFDEIRDKSQQLEVASQHKSQFLANMSHELRTPLNAILGYTELMTDSAYGEPPEKMMGVLKRLEANGRHLLGLINDVLDLSKIEAGQLVLELSDYCIQDLARTVRSTLEPLAADKKLGFKLELSPELPPGHGDGRRLTQVLINLVGNAIKFTDTGEVAIKAEAHNGSFHVSVCDTGPGISAADQAKLFQEFQQADNAITRKKGGTGLGLAISKRIIEMHGGRIWVESQPGQGSTFAFTLPVIVERQVEAA
jgi:GAF domain-containing protein